jgi:hypothetical protein
MAVYTFQGPTDCIDGKIAYDDSNSTQMDLNQSGDALNTIIITTSKAQQRVWFLMMFPLFNKLPKTFNVMSHSLVMHSTSLATTLASTVACRRVTSTDFTEAGMTWNSRVHGSLLFNTTDTPANWITGNTSATNAFTFAPPGISDVGPHTISNPNLQALIQDAIDNRNGRLALLFYSTDDTTDGQDIDYYSSDYAVDTTKRPLLTIIGQGDRGRGGIPRGRGR